MCRCEKSYNDAFPQLRAEYSDYFYSEMVRYLFTAQERRVGLNAEVCVHFTLTIFRLKREGKIALEISAKEITNASCKIKKKLQNYFSKKKIYC